MNQPSEGTPLSLSCPNCFGGGCTSCNRSGYFNLTTCPMEFAGNEPYEIIRFARILGDKGLTPVAGGLLDQSSNFIEAANHVWAEDKLMGRDSGE